VLVLATRWEYEQAHLKANSQALRMALRRHSSVTCRCIQSGKVRLLITLQVLDIDANWHVIVVSQKRPENWRPQRDSNPCTQIENLMS
jgi:hypothetical protein